jgi:FKBP-type peptidyl-prolyl cis-trans isomerase FklB
MDKVSYALGMNVAQNLVSSGFSDIDLASFQDGWNTVFTGVTPVISLQEANAVLQEHFAKFESQKGQKAKVEGEAFLAENGQRTGVIKLESGLQYEVINSGDGMVPSAMDNVKCHYHGTLIDGTVFDSSVERGEPAVFPVGGVIQGWVEALQMMNVGSKWRLFIPPHLAYGSRGAGGAIGPDTTLVFDVELIGIE